MDLTCNGVADPERTEEVEVRARLDEISADEQVREFQRLCTSDPRAEGTYDQGTTAQTR